MMKAILFALFVGPLMVGCGESYDAIDLDDPEIRKGIIAKEMTPEQIAEAQELSKELLKKIEANKAAKKE